MSVFTMGGFEEDDVTSSDHAESARLIFQYIAKEFETVQAVIVDLRYNQGGYDAVSLELAGLFAADRHVAFRKKAFRSKGNKYDVVLTPSSPRRLAVPVAVLISEHSVSAAETAAVAFRTLSNAKLVGQQTQGALSDVLEKKLPNGWTFTLSNEIFETVDGEFPEGTGVLPHIATPQTGNPGSAMERFLPDIERARDALLHSR
jgi:C-terminal processing protease CtpA/Prc